MSETTHETLTLREQLQMLFSSMTSTEIAQLLAGSEFVDGGAVSIVPLPPDPSEAWKERAADYNSQYPGPVHWCRFIDIVAASGSLSFAAKQVGKSMKKVQDRRERFPEFATHVQAALDYFNSAVLERAAFVRAIDGVIEPVFNKGVVVGYVRRFSDALMNKLLEGNLDKYKNRIDVDVNAPVVIQGGLPARPLTAADVPRDVAERLGMTIDNPPQTPALEPPSE